jgi:hypothetical protein
MGEVQSRAGKSLREEKEETIEEAGRRGRTHALEDEAGWRSGASVSLLSDVAVLHHVCPSRLHRLDRSLTSSLACFTSDRLHREPTARLEA